MKEFYNQGSCGRFRSAVDLFGFPVCAQFACGLIVLVAGGTVNKAENNNGEKLKLMMGWELNSLLLLWLKQYELLGFASQPLLSVYKAL